MSKLPHGWNLLCDGGASEVTGELVAYLDVWAFGTRDQLQQQFNVDDMMHQMVQAHLGQPSMFSRFLQSYQMPSNWAPAVS